MKIGDVVESSYRAKWKGVILSLEDRIDAHPLARVKVLIDRNGAGIYRPRINTIDSGWLSVIVDADIVSMVKQIMEKNEINRR